MIAPQDLHHCREAIRTGSLSFHAASKLLPAKVRDPALALYAFCRLADDAVDDSADKAALLTGLLNTGADEKSHGRLAVRSGDGQIRQL